MVQIVPFDVEQWMDEYETVCKYNIAETCCDSISIAELTELGGSSSQSSENPITSALTSRRLDYGPIRGSEALRYNLVKIYNQCPDSPITPSNTLITAGAIAANFLAFYTFIHPGDHVICIHPTYQQLYTVPKSLGASISLWKLDPSTNWSASIDTLRSLFTPKTKMLIINNPNNPTGAIIPLTKLKQIADLAAEHDTIILSDEVYAPIFHSSNNEEDKPPSFLSLGYKKTLVTGSMSKAYSLAGARIGWIISHDLEMVEKMAAARDYNTISVSILGDTVAAYALSDGVREKLVKRNLELCERNLEVLVGFVEKHKRYLWFVKPVSGTTAFVRVGDGKGGVVDDVALCRRLIEDTGVLFVPGGLCFGVEEGEFRGYLRIGYACSTGSLEEGLEKFGEWIEGGGVERASGRGE